MLEWLDPSPIPVPPDLAAAVGGHPLVATTLARRGLTTPAAALAFLDPNHYAPCPPTDLPSVSHAADRIMAAIAHGEPIGIWGDFDVDGITAATVLYEALQALGAKIAFVHIPHREREGHGVHLPTFQQLLQPGVRLVITVDTGITAHEAIAYANSQDVDVIVTDHHTPESGRGDGELGRWGEPGHAAPYLPPAYAVVTNRLLPAGHPLAGLPGVGIAYLLAQVLASAIRNPQSAICNPLDLVALGIVADVAPLIADTRNLLQRGLSALRQTRRIGLQALLETAEIDQDGLTEEHIGFALAPRLNALGRLADASLGVELLVTLDLSRARIIAAQMEALNAQRQLLCSQVMAGALAQLERHPELLDEPVLVIGQETWPANVVGIVASRLVERFGRPAIVLSTPPGEIARGSARSLPGIDISAAIGVHRGMLGSFGGHPMAAGLSIAPERLAEFRRALGRTVTALAPPPLAMQIDAYLDWEEPGLELAQELDRLAPFGAGNPPLCFVTRSLHVVRASDLGRTGEHRRLTVADEAGHSRPVLWWHGADSPLPEGSFDLAYTLRTRNFRGLGEVQVEWLAWRGAGPVEVRPPAPERQIVDYRQVQNPLAVLQGLLRENPSLPVWAEVSLPPEVTACNRRQLVGAPALAVWTIPPGPREWSAALDLVQPETVYLFGQEPGTDDLAAFLSRLAGLVKYSLRARGGRVDYTELAAAMGHREETVQLGLRWLSAQEQVQVMVEDAEGMQLAAGDEAIRGSGNRQIGKSANRQIGESLQSRIQNHLAETAAYRRFWKERSVQPALTSSANRV